MTRHAAGFANYPGDVRHIAGEVKGPTTFGIYLLAVGGTYDTETDTTHVAFVTLTDVANSHDLVRDEFGTLQVRTAEPAAGA